jgi:hypothetical protein
VLDLHGDEVGVEDQRELEEDGGDLEGGGIHEDGDVGNQDGGATLVAVSEGRSDPQYFHRHLAIEDTDGLTGGVDHVSADTVGVGGGDLARSDQQALVTGRTRESSDDARDENIVENVEAAGKQDTGVRLLKRGLDQKSHGNGIPKESEGTEQNLDPDARVCGKIKKERPEVESVC